MANTPRRTKLWLALGTLAALGGGFWLFTYLMQTSAPFAEAVARISPTLANTFSCVADCESSPESQGLDRFDKGLPKF